MPLVVCDPQDAARMIARRKALGLDRFDEVWDGVYIMSPIANDEHQDIGTLLSSVLVAVVTWTGLAGAQEQLGRLRCGYMV